MSIFIEVLNNKLVRNSEAQIDRYIETQQHHYYYFDTLTVENSAFINWE